MNTLRTQGAASHEVPNSSRVEALQPDARPVPSFAQVVTREQIFPKEKRDRAIPRYVGGNITIAINEEDYKMGLSEFEYTLIGRLVLSKGDSPLTTKALKTRLLAIWSIQEALWKITPLGKGFYNMDLKTSLAKNKVFAKGTLFLKPGLFHISEWIPNFNPHM